MWSSLSVTLSLVSQSQSCLLEGCKHSCSSKTGNRNGMYSEIDIYIYIYKYNFFFLTFNKISVKVCSRLPLSEDKRATLDVLQGKPVDFAHSLCRLFPLSCINSEFIRRLIFTLLPLILMVGVHSPSPHPNPPFVRKQKLALSLSAG